jgi:hypothetical protein
MDGLDRFVRAWIRTVRVATSAGEVIGFRILQGLGGGMLMPVGFTLIALSAGARRVGRASPRLGCRFCSGPGATILLAARVLKPDASRVDAGKLDWLGAPLLCPGLAEIVFGLSETETHRGITRLIALGPILAGLAPVGLFIWHSLQIEHPLIDLRLSRSPGFSAAASTTFFLGAASFGTLLTLPLDHQVDRGESALNAGLLLAPQGHRRGADAPDQRTPDRPRRGRPGRASQRRAAHRSERAIHVCHPTYPLPAARLRAVRPRAGARRRGPALRRRGLPAPGLSTGAQRHRRAHPLRQIGGSIGTTLLAVVVQHEGTLLSRRCTPPREGC